MSRLLLIDDDAAGRQMAAFNLKKAGYEVDEAGDGQTGLSKFDRNQHRIVITDVRMPDVSGIEVTRKLQSAAPDTPVVVITAFANVDTAVDAMKAGAFEFIIKPITRDQLLMVVEKTFDHVRLAEENRDLKRRLLGVERPILFASEAMQSTVNMSDRVAASSATVLITGESGTGKELIARRIHGRSARCEQPFVPVNCAAIPAELIESELFGHQKGAFTGASHSREGRFRQAHGGTLFLDEVGELPLPAQSKLLRVLQEGYIDVVGADHPVNVDVRVLAATNKDLRASVQAGAFREDLYFRLNVVELQVPPLRRRSEDIGPLVRHFVAEFADGAEVEIPPAVMQELERRPWVGNVRELRNACERMVILRNGDQLDKGVLPPLANDDAPNRAPADLDRWLPLPENGLSLLDLERRVIERVLALKGGNMSETARYLQIPRHVLIYRIEKYGIPRPKR